MTDLKSLLWKSTDLRIVLNANVTPRASTPKMKTPTVIAYVLTKILLDILV
jgi:hypothetical protein